MSKRAFLVGASIICFTVMLSAFFMLSNFTLKTVSSQPVSEMVGIGAVPTTSFYAIKRTNITNAASVNLAFGFMSKKVIVETDIANTADVVVDWLGGTAVAPAANTAGDDRIAPGRIVVFDTYSVTSISVIGDAVASQTVSVRAYN